MTKIDDNEATGRFWKFYKTEITDEIMAQLTPRELMEIAYKAAARDYTLHSIEMLKVLADPRMLKLAGIVAFKTPDAA